MQRTHLIALALGLCAFTAAAVYWQFSGSSSSASLSDKAAEQPADNDKTRAGTASSQPSVASPFAVQESTVASESLVNDSIVTPGMPTSLELPQTTTLDQSAPDIDITALGYTSINDAEFEQLVAQLRSSPELLQQLIDEFRQETDPARLVELSRLLGEVGGSAVTLTASELIYSGDPEARQIGLELLQQVQPGNAQARDIASSLLATEVEPEVLVGTLTTLAKPGSVDAQSREFLSEQVAILTTHEDATVRGISLNILSRWSTDGQYTPVLINGLSDSVDVVRESAAYALVGHEDASDSVINALFAVATNTAEDAQARRGSILALRGMSISELQREALIQAERELDTQKR